MQLRRSSVQNPAVTEWPRFTRWNGTVNGCLLLKSTQLQYKARISQEAIKCRQITEQKKQSLMIHWCPYRLLESARKVQSWRCDASNHQSANLNQPLVARCRGTAWWMVPTWPITCPHAHAPLWWSHPDSPQRLDHGPSSNTKRYGWSDDLAFWYQSNDSSLIQVSIKMHLLKHHGWLVPHCWGGGKWSGEPFDQNYRPHSATSLLPKRPTKLKAVLEFHKTLRTKWATVKYDQVRPVSKNDPVITEKQQFNIFITY